MRLPWVSEQGDRRVQRSDRSESRAFTVGVLVVEPAPNMGFQPTQLPPLLCSDLKAQRHGSWAAEARRWA